MSVISDPGERWFAPSYPRGAMLDLDDPIDMARRFIAVEYATDDGVPRLVHCEDRFYLPFGKRFMRVRKKAIRRRMWRFLVWSSVIDQPTVGKEFRPRAKHVDLMIEVLGIAAVTVSRNDIAGGE